MNPRLQLCLIRVVLLITIIGITGCRNPSSAGTPTPSPEVHGTPTMTLAHVTNEQATPTATQSLPAEVQVRVPVILTVPPSGWHLTTAADTNLSAELLSITTALSQNPDFALDPSNVRVIVSDRATPAKDEPIIVLFPMPRLQMSLPTQLRLIADTITDHDGIDVGEPEIDYNLRAGKGPTGLVKYTRSDQESGSERSGHLIVVPMASSQYDIVLLTEDRGKPIAPLLEAIVPTLNFATETVTPTMP